MELGLKDKVAAVTASSLGLGKAIAMELARRARKSPSALGARGRSTRPGRKSRPLAAKCCRALPT